MAMATPEFRVFQNPQHAVGTPASAWMPDSILVPRPLQLPQPAALMQQIAAVEKHARTRTLEDRPGLVRDWLTAIEQAYRAAVKCPPSAATVIKAKVHGGAVPNSCRYKSDATTAVLKVDGAVSATRSWAVRAPGGSGPVARVDLCAAQAPPPLRACLGLAPGAVCREFQRAWG